MNKEAEASENLQTPAFQNIISRYRQQKDLDHIALLQEIQDYYRYLPPEALRACSEELGIPLNHLYSIATFYSCFSLLPKGKYQIQVCMGTACHVRGAPKILERISQKLHLQPGGTDADLNYTLETVNCVGACARGPLALINEEYYGNLTMSEVDTLLNREGEGDHEQNRESR